jgi:hypothetical protein
MRKFIIVLFLLIPFVSWSGFITTAYYINQEPAGCHHLFVVVTFDNGDGNGPIYMGSGEVAVGSGCPQIAPQSDPSSVIDLGVLVQTPEVNEAMVSFLISKGFPTASLLGGDSVQIMSAGNGTFIVSRESNTINRIEIKDSQGITVAVLEPDPGLRSESYDINNLQNGIYIIGVSKAQIVIKTGQIIKQ